MKTTTLKDIRNLFDEKEQAEKFPITVIQAENYEPSYTQVETEIEKGSETPLKVLDAIFPPRDTWVNFEVQGAAWSFKDGDPSLYLFNAYAPVFIYVQAGTLIL